MLRSRSPSVFLPVRVKNQARGLHFSPSMAKITKALRVGRKHSGIGRLNITAKRFIKAGGAKQRNSPRVKAMKSAAIHNYPQASRAGKKALVTYLEPQLAQRVKFVASIQGQTVQDYVSALIENDVQNQKKAIRATMHQLTAPVSAPSRSGTSRHVATHANAPTRS